MAVRDISMSRDGVERITEIMLLSAIEQRIPFIFGADAKVVKSDQLTSLGMRPDFIVSLSRNDYAIVEVKNQASNTLFRLDAVANQLLDYSNAFKHLHPTAHVRLVLIMNGALSGDNKAYLANRGIDRVIDTAELQQLAGSSTAPKAGLPVAEATDVASAVGDTEAAGDKASESTVEVLLTMLDRIPPGRSTWSQYQKLTGNILEFLFCPKLGKPISELSNQTRTNRRDFIFPNYATAGFWAFLRSHYAAHFIVVDAKNLTRKVGKTEVLQLANYLSGHGAGLFGLVVSRNQCAYSAGVTQREQWAIHRKMIIMLDDADLKQMFAVQLSGGDPSDLIRQKIEDFRLSF